jgi:hypothetical protein
MPTEACEVQQDLAYRIGEDILERAEAFAALAAEERDVLIAPFVEEVFEHEPLEGPLDLRGKVTVVVRNSLLQQAHHNGPLESGMGAVTRHATGRCPIFSRPDGASPSAMPGGCTGRVVLVPISHVGLCLVRTEHAGVDDLLVTLSRIT